MEESMNLTIEVKRDEENEKGLFVDSYGRRHTAAFLDPHTGKPILP
jgi:hypothetical protein